MDLLRLAVTSLSIVVGIIDNHIYSYYKACLTLENYLRNRRTVPTSSFSTSARLVSFRKTSKYTMLSGSRRATCQCCGPCVREYTSVASPLLMRTHKRLVCRNHKRCSHDQLAPVEQVLRAGREICTRDRSAFACRYHVFILWLENPGSRERCFGVASFLMVYQPLYVRQESR